MNWKRILTWLGVCTVVGLLAGGVFTLWNVWRVRRFGVVKKGAIYRSCKPTAEQMERLIHRYGIKTVVSFRWKPDPYDPHVVEEFQLNHVKIPIHASKPIAKDAIERFFDVVDEPKNWPVLVHCGAGEERTGLMIALYRRRRNGWTSERAIAEMKEYDFELADADTVLAASVLRLLGEENAAASPSDPTPGEEGTAIQ